MHKIALILDDIRSTHNVGSILRTADGFGVSHVFFSGYTPYPAIANDTRMPHEREKLTKAIHKTALGAENTMPFSIHESINDAVASARNHGFIIAGLEQSPDSKNLVGYKAMQDIAIVLGNEVNGVSNDTLKVSDLTLEIPMFGKKESFNVSVSAAICLYELTRDNNYAK